MIDINDQTKIYIFCGAKAMTGGSESIHQLYYNLKHLGYKAFMYYLPINIEDPIAPNFKKYEVELVKSLEDSPNNVLIVPEVATYLLYRYHKIKKVIFWLSVDNYFVSLKKKEKKGLKYFIKFLLGYNRKFLIDVIKTHNNILHISQSKYAIEFLKTKGISDVHYMPDYIHKDFMNQISDCPNRIREDIVLYNPAKGLEFTRKLITRTPNLQWVALENLTTEQIKSTLLASKVYVDFGNHPGKDRFPREAALLGCCIITGKKGSAFFTEDVAIPEHFKFEESEVDRIVLCIESCLSDYDNKVKEFESYRQFTLAHEPALLQHIKLFFKRPTITE